MRHRASVVVLTMCLWSCVYGHQYEITLDPNGHYKFQWSVDYVKDEIDARLTAKVSSTSWFAIGFSNYGDVTSSDLLAFWTDVTTVHHLVDSHTDANGVLSPDNQQDYHVTSVASRPDGIVLEFHRKFDTCDPYDYILDNGTTHMVYVEGRASRPRSSPFGLNVSAFHHGVQRFQILKPALPKVKVPEDTWTFEVRAPEILIPAKETTYWWHTTILPSIQNPHHIIKYEGVIGEGSQDLVHHMEVFHCELPPDGRIPFYNGPGHSEGQPKGLGVCRKVIGAWAMGAQAMVYPAEAGVPIGGPNSSRFALLEVHYNNPGLKAGHMDTSGIRFYVTAELRPHDAGIMELGLEYTNKMAIPPGQKAFQLHGYCVDSCTSLALPPKGIQVFASQLHTHLTGRQVVTKHFRHGRQLPDLNRDDHYSPHYQEIRPLAMPVQVIPGDLLMTSCAYDTRTRVTATIGGFAISDEMCVNYIHYYPKTDLEVCKSSVQAQALDTFFRFLQRLGMSHRPLSDGDRAIYRSIDWSPLTSHLLDFLYDVAPISMQCNKSDGSRFPGQWDHIAMPISSKQILSDLHGNSHHTCNYS